MVPGHCGVPVPSTGAQRGGVRVCVGVEGACCGTRTLWCEGVGAHTRIKVLIKANDIICEVENCGMQYVCTRVHNYSKLPYRG